MCGVQEHISGWSEWPLWNRYMATTRLAGSALVEDRITFDGPTVTALVRENLARRRREECNTLDDLIEKGVEFGSGKKSIIRGRMRRYVNQLMMETISLLTLRWTLLRRSKEAWSNPSSEDLNTDNK